MYGSSQTSGRNEENTRYIILPHIRSVSQLRPYLAFSASWVYTHNICAIFDYAGYAAVRASVETKKKQDISSLHTYAGYAAARAPVELKKKQDISFFHTYAVFLS